MCGTSGERFIALSDSSGAAGQDQAKQPLPQKPPPGDSHPERKWRCSVCGYIHTGPEPPEKCPVCGADRSLFAEIIETKQPEATHDPTATDAATTEKKSIQPPTSIWMQRFELAREKMVEFHAHPIFVHIPNGLLPIAVLFLLMAVVFGSETLSKASFYNLIVVTLAMPAVLFSGYNDWQKRFGGHMTLVFMIKMVCGATISLGSLVLVVWRLLSPGVVSAGSSVRWGYLLIHIVLLGAAIVAGFYGGKLVIFPDGSSKK